MQAHDFATYALLHFSCTMFHMSGFGAKHSKVTHEIQFYGRSNWLAGMAAKSFFASLTQAAMMFSNATGAMSRITGSQFALITVPIVFAVDDGKLIRFFFE